MWKLWENVRLDKKLKRPLHVSNKTHQHPDLFTSRMTMSLYYLLTLIGDDWGNIDTVISSLATH